MDRARRSRMVRAVVGIAAIIAGGVILSTHVRTNASRLALGLVVVATGLVLLATLIIAAVSSGSRRRRPVPPWPFPPPDFVPDPTIQPRDQ